MKVLLCGIDSIRNHQSPYENICFGSSHAIFNYPIIWGIFTIFPFFTLSNSFEIGFGLIIIFLILFFNFISKINLFESIIYSLFIISPAVALALERGNSDLIILIFLLLILYFKNKILIQSFFILLFSMLKLYPIAAILMIIVDKISKRYKFVIFAVFLLLFSLYAFLSVDNIGLVSNKTPRPFEGWSYGLGTIPSLLYLHFNQHKVLIFISFISCLLFWLIIVCKKIFPFLQTMVVENGVIGKAYFMGSGIFIFTCLIGYNFEYRLIFLLLTLPQILYWTKQRIFLSYFAIIITLLIVYQTAIVKFFKFFHFPYYFYYYYRFVGAIFVVMLFSFFLSFLYYSILIEFNKKFITTNYNS